MRIRILKDGPYRVTGGVPLAKDIIGVDGEGESVEWVKGKEYPKKESYILCRCGKSKNMPYCDGSHVKAKFNGTETASKKPYAEQAETFTGPGLVMTDVVKLCAIARFCYPQGDAWTLTEHSDDPKARDKAIDEIKKCPAGRIVARDKGTGEAMEPKLEPSIGVVEDPQKNVSGPLWVKGGIPVESSDGTVYEVRNRVTLCRCGRSKNKPFCDGKHIPAHFKDE